jgi:uncharacterized protein (DUF1778 family)
MYDYLPYIREKIFAMDAISTSNKDERIEIRISAADKQVFMKAQKMSGDKSFSSFLVRIVKEKASEIIAKNEAIIASEQDREKFFEAVFSSQKPNQKLTEAAKRYKSKFSLL